MQKEGHPFTKKQLGIIFKIAFLEAMALSLVLPSVTSSGELASSPGCVFNQFTMKGCQKGTVNITVLDRTNSTTFTVPFPSAFAPLPTPLPNIFLSSVSSIAAFSYLRDSGPSIRLLASGVPVTWTSMPTIETEFNLNGLPNPYVDRVLATLPAEQFFRFSVDCSTSSTSANAYLFPEYSSDNGVSFNLLNKFANVSIGTGVCPNGPLFATSVGGANGCDAQGWCKLPFGWVKNSTTTPNPETITLSFFGNKGNGAGDNPTFNNINIEFAHSVTIASIFPLQVTTTKFTFDIVISAVLNQNAVIPISWLAISS